MQGNLHVWFGGRLVVRRRSTQPYEYSDYNNVQWAEPSAEPRTLAFDSYMVAEDDLKHGQLRLLETDNAVFVPVGTHIRFLVTSDDVLHS